MNDITNMEDILDVRSIIERFEELEGEKQNLEDALTEAHEAMEAAADNDQDLIDAYETAKSEYADWASSEDNQEFETLEKLLDDLRGNGGDEQWRGDWYPVTLICDSYFEDYARELVQDIGDMPNGIPHYIEIDWERTARNIRVDYSSVEFDGVTYWYR